MEGKMGKKELRKRLNAEGRRPVYRLAWKAVNHNQGGLQIGFGWCDNHNLPLPQIWTEMFEDVVLVRCGSRHTWRVEEVYEPDVRSDEVIVRFRTFNTAEESFMMGRSFQCDFPPWMVLVFSDGGELYFGGE